MFREAQGLMQLLLRRRQLSLSKLHSKALSSFWCSRFCGVKGLCSRAKAGSSREIVDLLLDRCGDRNHENGDGEDEDEDEDDVLLLLLLLPLLLVLSPLVGVDDRVVEDDDIVVSLFPELAVDCFRLGNLNLPRLMLMMTSWFTLWAIRYEDNPWKVAAPYVNKTTVNRT
ncbi:hypothetical protein E0Z10_g7686 [Xylaria hypoxylon]|uniref:Uncharacterized protein n=1 Tax=Xylaria hypoxylon TaxID=37992 RepID=A0A4Z0YD94_9PEZI|nr:hypothetical protein E0Z10_g7686 [Xylaria hypoxylon]